MMMIFMLPIAVWGQTQDYKVKKGETLYGLSQRYNTTVSKLLDINPSIVDNKLKEGALIKVPMMKEEVNYNKVKIGPPQFLAPVTYSVSKGETLYSISKKMNTNVETLRMYNELKNDDIKAGQKLIVGYTGSDSGPNTGSDQNSTLKKNESNSVENKISETKKDVVVNDGDKDGKKKKSNSSTSDSSVKKENGTSSTTGQTANNTVVSQVTTNNSTSVDSKNENKNPVSTSPTNETSNTSENKVPVTNSTSKNSSTSTTTVVSNTVSGNQNKSSEDSSSKTNATSSSNKSTPSNEKLVYLTEKGVVTWTKTNNDDGQFYCLHPTAPVGTVITLKNMMNNRSVQVKVIGKLPATAENQNVIMKISNSAAKNLNVLDDKFLATANFMGYKTE